jgi:hypothetical protein
MSDGSDLGSDPTYSTNSGPFSQHSPEGSGINQPAPHAPNDTPDQKDCGALIDVDVKVDLGGLIGSPGSLIDVDFGQGDGHTAAILDIVVGDDSLLDATVLSGMDVFGGNGTCNLLDGLFDDCSLL